MGDLARHLLDLHKHEKTSEFPAIYDVIEDLNIGGDDSVREIAAIGFLESIQNIWSNANVSPEEFGKHLLPASKKMWDELNNFWSGKIP